MGWHSENKVGFFLCRVHQVKKNPSFLKSSSHADKKKKSKLIFFIWFQSKLEWKEVFLHYTNMAQIAGGKSVSNGESLHISVLRQIYRWQKEKNISVAENFFGKYSVLQKLVAIV